MRVPDIRNRPGLENRHLIIEGHRGLRSWEVIECHGRIRKVKEDHGRSRKIMEGLSLHWIYISGEKSYGWVVVACRIIVSAQSLWIWDFGLGLGLDHRSKILTFILNLT